MGFLDWPHGIVLSAQFYGLHVFAVRGITLDEKALMPATGMACGKRYRICYGNSINAICQKLLGQDFSEDEESWLIQKKAVAPFVVLQFGPEVERNVVGRLMMERDNEIITYSAFRSARMSLGDAANKCIPSIIVSQELAFRPHRHDVNFSFVDKMLLGVNDDGRLIHDVVFTASARSYGSGKVDLKDMDSTVLKGVKAAEGVSSDFSIFFRMASEELDALDFSRALIHYFLSIELSIKRQFGASSGVVASMIDLVSWARLSLPSAEIYLIKNNVKDYKSLAAKFIHCVFSNWGHLNDSDFLNFMEIKRWRDDMSHGDVSSVPESIAVLSRNLALKLHPAVT